MPAAANAAWLVLDFQNFGVFCQALDMMIESGGRAFISEIHGLAARLLEAVFWVTTTDKLAV
jgi:hypothetical protein